MKVMVLVKATKSSESGKNFEGETLTQLLEEMGKYNEELIKAGILVTADGLQPSSKGVRVRFSGKNRVVTNGPFTETNELVAGFWIWNVKSLEEAIDWVKKCPNPMLEDSDIEIRPFNTWEDFGDAVTPELRENEAFQRAESLGLCKPTLSFMPDMVIAGLNEHYTMETRVGIPGHWERFVKRAGELHHNDGIFFGVSWNSKPDCTFDYLTGAIVTDEAALPSDFTSLKLDARRWAVFHHTGHVSALPKTIDTIWSKWVPECGLKIAYAPCVERYTKEFDGRTGMGGMEIWIGLDS